MKVIISGLLMLVAFCFIMYPMYYWFNHDTLTGMQMLKEMWTYYAVYIVCYVVSRVLSGTN